ncbi:MAG TPA: BTAD domain-containing putative transcriptional regulator, partial [Acidimicrobiales bacterium]|nr:BTAD domain-containing putative transcriptional regulator [Acidimicrobiales bacterium]
IEIDPVDERRYLALAQLLAATGRPAAAMKELSRATEMAEELGVKPSAALEDLKLSLLETT